ncbi:hypothetical protein HPB50_023718 [Hyalomma asiaticum]|uniref:Uncharacterized protein n=1 Tax=Hyalomma asiaticum TaxID=266040 RepID=A0ACB7TBM4_HYAAI|nr:hypothetical protein HPB50_023718 [Hyalomma asiaticum]
MTREGDWVYLKTVRQEKVSLNEGQVVRPVSSVTYLVETQSTVRHVHVDHLRSRSSSKYAGSNIGSEALARPSTEDSAGLREAPTTAYQAHPEATTEEHLPDDTTVVVPPPTGRQKSPLPVAHDELPQAPEEEPSESPPALRRSQRARKEPDRYVPHDFRH